MAGVNKAIVLGHLGRDPEIRSLANGGRVASMSLATTETWRDKASGERKERTEWHDVVIYNENIIKVAESYLKKGSKVYVEGQMIRRKWQDAKTGQEKQRTEIHLGAFRGELTLLDSRQGDRPPLDNPRDAGASQPQAASSPGNVLDDDIPF